MVLPDWRNDEDARFAVARVRNEPCLLIVRKRLDTLALPAVSPQRGQLRPRQGRALATTCEISRKCGGSEDAPPELGERPLGVEYPASRRRRCCMMAMEVLEESPQGRRPEQGTGRENYEPGMVRSRRPVSVAPFSIPGGVRSVSILNTTPRAGNSWPSRRCWPRARGSCSEEVMAIFDLRRTRPAAVRARGEAVWKSNVRRPAIDATLPL